MIRRFHAVPFLALAAALCIGTSSHAARQSLALFRPHILPAGADNVLLPAISVLEDTLKEKLSTRFDVRPAGEGSGHMTEETRRRKARALGASYSFTGTLSRIGKFVTFDSTIAPVEEPEKGRTVVVTGRVENPSAASPGDIALFRRLGAEAAHEAMRVFFGGPLGGASGSMKTFPVLPGTIRRSASLPGDVVSVAFSDTDLDGRPELIAAGPDTLVVYGVEGDELREEARIEHAGPGIIRVDAAGVTRNGTADIVTVRYIGGRVLSDIRRFDGKEYRKTSSDIPYFLRTADLGQEGVVLLGQEADPATVYRGPVFRVGVGGDGRVGVADRDHPLPLPPDTFLFSFISLRKGKEMRFAVLNARGRLVYSDDAGKTLEEGMTPIGGSGISLEGTARRQWIPGRMLAVDWDRDGTEELVLLSGLVRAGTFFENLRFADSGEILCFTQKDASLSLAWRSPLLEIVVRDLTVDRFLPDGPRFVVASRERGKFPGIASEWRALWVK